MMKGNKVVLKDESGGTSTVTIKDVNQSNGVIHVVDHVLLPKNVVRTVDCKKGFPFDGESFFLIYKSSDNLFRNATQRFTVTVRDCNIAIQTFLGADIYNSLASFVGDAHTATRFR